MLKDINFVIFFSLYIFVPLGIFNLIDAKIQLRKAKKRAEREAKIKAEIDYYDYIHSDPNWFGE